MDNFTFSQRSLKNLRGVHSHLIAITARALQLSATDFTVICGLRTHSEQNSLYELGLSKTLTSAHLTGYAIDFAPFVNGEVNPHNRAAHVEVAKAFMQAAEEFDVSIRWGGDWDQDGDHKDERFFDGAHIELARPAHDWGAPIPATRRDEWPGDQQSLLRFNDPELCPVAFSATAYRKRRKPFHTFRR